MILREQYPQSQDKSRAAIALNAHSLATERCMSPSHSFCSMVSHRRTFYKVVGYSIRATLSPVLYHGRIFR
jgi:hypothetical protein